VHHVSGAERDPVRQTRTIGLFPSNLDPAVAQAIANATNNVIA